jgi:hypothetical protein
MNFLVGISFVNALVQPLGLQQMAVSRLARKSVHNHFILKVDITNELRLH